MSTVTRRKVSIAAAFVLVVLLVVMTASSAMAASAYYWTTVRDANNGNLNALTATDADHVWGVASGGNSVIFNSSNAGAAVPTWNDVTVMGVYISGIFALDGSHIWAAGGNAAGAPPNTSAILCWNPAGAGSWDAQNNNGTAYQFNGATALSSTQAWVCGNDAGTPNKGRILWSNGGAYNSGAGGTAWVDDFVDPTVGGCPIKNVSAAGTSVWAVGYEAGTYDGKIFKRVGANNWTLQKTVTGWRLYGIKALDDNHAWAAGRNGTVLYTNDGGTNWLTATTPGTVDLQTITATDMNNAWAAGNAGTVYTWTGGAWRTDVVPMGTDSGKGSASPDANHVYIGTGASTRNRVFRGAPLRLASCTPASGLQGQTMNIDLLGTATHFVNGVSHATFRPATGITVNSTTVTDATHATANITIAAGAPKGARDVNVVTGTEVPNPLAGGFTVKAVHTITVNSGPNGAIAPAGPVKVIEGSNQAFTITPAAGYHTVDVAVDGVHMGVVTDYTFENVTTDHLITATFSNQYSTWYLAEGSTAWGFGSGINIQNPNDQDLNANVTYMLKDGTTKQLGVGLPKMSKTSVSPMDTIGAADFSTKVECVQGKTIAVDRTMGWQSGQGNASGSTNSIGVTGPSTAWYLPEGSSNWGFETWLLIQNPNDVAASCDVTYMIEGVGPKTVNHTVAAHSRATYNMTSEIGAADASIEVNSNVGVIPERSMYTPWPAGSGNTGRREGHESIGALKPASDFFLAEGTTAWGFTTYVLIQNPNPTPTNVTLTYMTNSGPIADAPFTMAANSRKTVRVNDKHAGMDLSTRVHADKPIVAERSMFWTTPDVAGQATHDSIGTSEAHMTWYLPDGSVGPDDGGYETFTLLQNPNSMPVQVRVSYLNEGGKDNVVFTDTVAANSRKTFNMGDKYPGTNGASASTMVESLTPGKKVIVEHSMYNNGRWGGSNSIGGYSD